MSEIYSKIDVSIAEQLLRLSNRRGCVAEYPVATAKNGTGQQNGSECTPLGKHRIRAMIGSDQLANTIFVARRPTGELYTPQLRQQFPKKDWILTRILWLCGCEVGFNRGGGRWIPCDATFIFMAPQTLTQCKFPAHTAA